MSKQTILAQSEIFDDDKDKSLRPLSFREFIGQTKSVANLNIFIDSAKKRSDSLDHVLLFGPPGLGKTTLAQIISKELKVNFRATSGPIITKAGDLAALLTNLEKGDVLFIDEIHRLSTQVEEMLYSAMEDFCLDIIIGEGPQARSVRIDLPKFTLVGATTRLGLISNPLKDRFGIPLGLEFYNHKELIMVIKRGANVLEFEITDEGANEIAKRARGTPRIALRLLKRVRDFAINLGDRAIDNKNADYALNMLGVDSNGLDISDQKYLRFILDKFGGGPVGIDTIAAGMAEDKDTVEEAIEPYLLQQGFINRTPRGRVLSKIGFEYFGLTPPNNILQDGFLEE